MQTYDTWKFKDFNDPTPFEYWFDNEVDRIIEELKLSEDDAISYVNDMIKERQELLASCQAED